MPETPAGYVVLQLEYGGAEPSAAYGVFSTPEEAQAWADGRSSSWMLLLPVTRPTSQCDGGFRCPAVEHIEGCYTGDGHPDAQPSKRPSSQSAPSLDRCTSCANPRATCDFWKARRLAPCCAKCSHANDQQAQP